MKHIMKTIIPDAFIRALWHFPRAILAPVLFFFPARSLTCLAVAGTKGKTSTAFFLAHLLRQAGYRTALFSTAAVHDGTDSQLNAWKMTTPPALSVQRFLRKAVNNGCSHAVLEVSSHALKQYRVWSVPFALVLITNLAPDHLDYHESAEEYAQVHEKLFSNTTRFFCHSRDLDLTFHLSRFPSLKRYCIEDTMPSDASRATQDRPWWFSLQRTNINAALCAARALGCHDHALEHALKTLPCPPGRFESIDEGQSFRVIVDYAHSPESLEYFLSRIRPLVGGRLIVVFGACGDRDRTMRPVMGATLERYADVIILTTDDPYSENPADIARDVEQKMKEKKYTTVLDRTEAIGHALARAQQNDCVCVLGKGAEQWQIFNNKKIPWDDRKTARELLQRIVYQKS